MSKETVYYAENAAGRIYLCSPQSDLKEGYALRSTNKASEMDKLFSRISRQEHEQNEKFIEKMWSRGRENYERMRSELNRKLNLGSTSNAERAIIRASLKLMDEKDRKAQENHVYGVSALQEAPEPLPARNVKVTIQ
jgi:hypothetical protein